MGMDYSQFGLPKPGKRTEASYALKYAYVLPGVRRYPSGREVCDKTPAGKTEYSRRRELMWERQDHRCAYCNKLLAKSEATFEHVIPRGTDGCFRDDRIWDGEGNPMNLCACFDCNHEKGSRRLWQNV